MLNLVLFGPPGAGKGTQSEKLLEHYNLIHLSTGDVFRYNIKNQTKLGVRAKSYMDQGELVPDDVTINMVRDFIKKSPNSTNGFIFDGFPRTVEQGKALDEMLQDFDTEITMMVALEVEEGELVRRLLERGKVSGRADDQSENTIRNRFAEYNFKTAPLKEYYADQGKFYAVKGMGSIDEIFNRLTKTIDKVINL